MKILYINNYDSFAGNVAAFMESAAKYYDPKSEVIRYTSGVDISVLVEENPDFILLGPGPSSPKEAGNYLDVLDRFHKTYPIFGICLGFQSMMHYFDRPVRVLEEAVHGASSNITHSEKGIFNGIKSPATFGRYHSLGIYSDEIPPVFDVLAEYPDSNGKQIVMAGQHKELPIAGVQFHPESILSIINNDGERLMRNAIDELFYKRNNQKH